MPPRSERRPAAAIAAAALAASAAGSAAAVMPAIGGGEAAAAGSPAAHSARAATLTIALATASGPFGEQNAAIQRGAILRAAQVNADGGVRKRIRLRTVRIAVDGLSADRLRARLRAVHARVLVLPCDSDAQLRVVPAAATFRMLMLAPCTPDASFGRRFPTYWGVGAAANSEAGGIASFIAQAGYPRVFTIAGRGAYGSLLERYFVHAAPLSRLRIVGRAGISDPDGQAAALARAITASRATSLFTSMSPPQVGRLVMQLRRRDITLPVFGTTTMDTTRTLRGGVRSLQESYVASYGFVRETKGGQRFRNGYRLRFNRAPVGSYPGLGYETIRVLEAAVRRARSAQPSAIQRALAGGLTVRGIALPDRTYVRGGSHNPVTSVAISKVLGRRLRPVFSGVPAGRIPPP